MKQLLILGYILATAGVIVGEYNAIMKGYDYLNHIVWGGMIVWNILVVIGFLQRAQFAFNMIKVGSYFQLFVIAAGFVAYVTGIGYNMELNNKNVTIIGSLVVILWAAFKISATKKHYAKNT